MYVHMNEENSKLKRRKIMLNSLQEHINVANIRRTEEERKMRKFFNILHKHTYEKEIHTVYKTLNSNSSS